LAVATGILASRVAGLLRFVVLSTFLGGTVYADVFTLGLRLPNLLQNLLGEGTLSASFIPVYSDLLASGQKEEAGRVAGAVLALLVAVAGVLVVVGIVGAPILVTVAAAGFDGEQYTLAVVVVRILFPMTGLLVLSAWALGVLNSHRLFLVSYLAPVVWNLAIIGALVGCGWGLGWGGRELLVAAAVGALLGGLLQLVVQLPAVWRREPHLRIRWEPGLPGVRTVLRNAFPAVLGRGVSQLSAYVDMLFASLLAVGAVWAIGYAQALYLLPVSLFGMSVAAAELPELSRERALGHEALRARTRAALDRTAFFVVPVTLAYVVFGGLVLSPLESGAFGRDDRLLVHATLAAYSVGLVASVSARVLSSAYYALHDTRTPARFATLRVVCSAVVGFAAMAQLEPLPDLGLSGGRWSGLTTGGPDPKLFGAAGLALGTGVAAWVEWGCLRRGLRERIGLRSSQGRTARLWVAALAGTAAAWGVWWVAGAWPAIVAAPVVLGVAGTTYVILCAALGVEEPRRVWRRLASRHWTGVQ
jgi:putative peptidoglycan lipid II flippase